MIPQWKTISEHGIPENKKAVMFFDSENRQYIGYFHKCTRGEDKGCVFVEARMKNESNGMFGSYVYKWNNYRNPDGLADIARWDYLPEE